MYDLGEDKQISGIAIQGNPSEDKWVKTFEVQYGSTLSSLTTFLNGSDVKEFVGCRSRDLVVYNWFPTEITTRYLKIVPKTSQGDACLRLNVFGCPWSACQVGFCSPKEASSGKPWIQLCLASASTISAVIIQGHGDQDNLADATTVTVQYSYTASGTLIDYKHSGRLVWLFAISTGRYGSQQINFPVAFVAKCIRINVESQTNGGYNVGLRWEILGCDTVKKVSLSLSSSLVTIKRGSYSAVTCSGRGQEGGIMSFKIAGTTLVNSDIYNIGNQVRSSYDINGELRRQIEITAKRPSIASSSCSVTDAAQGLAQCQQTIECTLVYAGIPELGDSKSFNVTVTDLIGRPQAPSGLQTDKITQTSAKITWNASIPGDFRVENYKVSIKKKRDGLFARPDQMTVVQEVIFNNLTAFTEYTVEISARAVTLNIYSAKRVHHFTTDEGAATAPIGLRVTSITDTRIKLEWKQPTSLNGNLYEYLIRYKKTTASIFLPVLSAGKESSKTVENLDILTDYHFQVSASTKHGAIIGDWSPLISVKTRSRAYGITSTITTYVFAAISCIMLSRVI